MSLPSLSEIEREVLESAGRGETAAELACKRHRSIWTVKDQRSAVLKKLGAHNMDEAVQIAAAKPGRPAQPDAALRTRAAAAHEVLASDPKANGWELLELVLWPSAAVEEAVQIVGTK